MRLLQPCKMAKNKDLFKRFGTNLPEHVGKEQLLYYSLPRLQGILPDPYLIQPPSQEQNSDAPQYLSKFSLSYDGQWSNNYSGKTRKPFRPLWPLSDRVRHRPFQRNSPQILPLLPQLCWEESLQSRHLPRLLRAPLHYYKLCQSVKSYSAGHHFYSLLVGAILRPGFTLSFSMWSGNYFAILRTGDVCPFLDSSRPCLVFSVSSAAKFKMATVKGG